MFKKGYTPWNKGKSSWNKDVKGKNSHMFGKIPWNKGKLGWRVGRKLSEEHKEKIRRQHKINPHMGMKGKHFSEETKQKLRILGLGKIISQEQRKKMSDGQKELYNKGYINPMKGKLKSYEERLRISQSKQNLPIETRLKISKSQQTQYNFIPFKQKLSKRIRANAKYLEWRSNIFKRDNYHCQNCGKTNCYLEVHHLVPFSYLISICNINSLEQAINCKSLWDEGNGITYCRDCHILLDKNIGIGLTQTRRKI